MGVGGGGGSYFLGPMVWGGLKEDKSYIPQCKASNYIIKLARTRDPFISNGHSIAEIFWA